MARNRLADYMQSYRFWLFDAIPSLTPPFYVLGAPFFGFNAITAPEYTAEVDEIKQLNSMFKKYAYSGGAASPITLTRGVRGFDNTMWDWMYRALIGLEVTNRHLVLMQYTSINITAGVESELGQFAANAFNPNTAWEAANFVPGKAWLLWNCIPTRYKAGSDFDATSGDVSLSELDVQPEAITEFALLDPI